MQKIKTTDLLRELNSETKLVILYFLIQKKDKCDNLCVTTIANITNRNVKNISKQLIELKKANILISIKYDREVFYKYNENLPEKIKNIISDIIKLYSKDPFKCPCISVENEREMRKNARS